MIRQLTCLKNNLKLYIQLFRKFVLDCSFLVSLWASKLYDIFIRSWSNKFLYDWVIFEVFIRVLVSEFNFVKSSNTSSSEHNVRWNLENFIIKIWNFIDDEIEHLKIFWLIWSDSGSAITPGLICWCLVVMEISD